MYNMITGGREIKLCIYSKGRQKSLNQNVKNCLSSLSGIIKLMIIAFLIIVCIFRNFRNKHKLLLQARDGGLKLREKKKKKSN